MDICLTIRLDDRITTLLQELLNIKDLPTAPEKQKEDTPTPAEPPKVAPMMPRVEVQLKDTLTAKFRSAAKPSEPDRYEQLLDAYRPRSRFKHKIYWDHPFFNDVPRRVLYEYLSSKPKKNRPGVVGMFPVWAERAQAHIDANKAFTLDDIIHDDEKYVNPSSVVIFRFLMKNKTSIYKDKRAFNRYGRGTEYGMVFYPKRLVNGVEQIARAFPPEPLFPPKASTPVRTQHNPNYYSAKDEAIDEAEAAR